MKQHFPLILALALLGLVGVVPTARAASLYGQSADLTGSRSVGNGLLGFNQYASTDITISWVITKLAGVNWEYSYTFKNVGAGTGSPTPPAMSHVVFDLTDNAVYPRDLDAVVDQTLTGGGSIGSTEFGTFTSSNGNPLMPAAGIIGVKFNTTNPSKSSFTITFTSNRAPVWGDIYLKGGNNSVVYNAGLTRDGTLYNLESPQVWIARPNGVVPEPASVAMVCMGALGVLGLGLRRKIRVR